MNWGHKITIVFIAFAAMMIYMVVTSYQANVDLVTEDYYLQELNYQDQIDKKQNVKADQKEVRYELTQAGLELYFPPGANEPLTGIIHMYRPSEADLDQKLDIATDSTGIQIIGPKQLVPGKYVLKIDWQEGGTPYYQEIELLIPGV